MNQCKMQGLVPYVLKIWLEKGRNLGRAEKIGKKNSARFCWLLWGPAGLMGPNHLPCLLVIVVETEFGSCIAPWKEQLEFRCDYL